MNVWQNFLQHYKVPKCVTKIYFMHFSCTLTQFLSSFFFSQIANFFFSPQKVENLSNKLGDSLKRVSSRFIAFEILKNMSYHIDDKYLDVVWVVFLLMWNNQVKWFSSLDNAVSVWKIIMNQLIIVSYYCVILFLLPLHCVGHI